jgi:prepilin-type processing-associated H-X9-DG protein
VNAFIILLPYLEEQVTYQQFDFEMPESDALTFVQPHHGRSMQAPNYKLRALQPSLFLCPSDTALGQKIELGHATGLLLARGNYAFITSVDRYLNNTGCSYDSPTNRRPAMYQNSNIRLSQLRDGISKTMVVSELLTPALGVGGGGENVNDAGGDWRGLWSESVGSLYSHMLTPNSSRGDTNTGGMVNDPANGTPALQPFFPYWARWANAARSRHSAGVNAGYLDGSVGFYSNEIDLALWQSMASIDGDELISEQK